MAIDHNHQKYYLAQLLQKVLKCNIVKNSRKWEVWTFHNHTLTIGHLDISHPTQGTSTPLTPDISTTFTIRKIRIKDYYQKKRNQKMPRSSFWQCRRDCLQEDLTCRIIDNAQCSCWWVVVDTSVWLQSTSPQVLAPLRQDAKPGQDQFSISVPGK